MINEGGTEDLESIAKSEVHRFKWTGQILDLLTYVQESVRGVTDAKGNQIIHLSPWRRAP